MYICTKHQTKQYHYIMNLATALAQSDQSMCFLYEESFPRRFFFCGYVMFLFCLVFAMFLSASVYMCFVVTCWERADLLALVCGV